MTKFKAETHIQGIPYATQKKILTEFKKFLIQHNAYEEFNKYLIRKLKRHSHRFENGKLPITTYVSPIITYIKFNTISTAHNYILVYRFTELISSAFTWSETKQGHSYWMHLDDAWRKCYRKNF